MVASSQRPFAALLALVVLAHGSLSGNAPRLTLDIPVLATRNVSPEIAPGFIGFAFELASFPRYSTDAVGHPNLFSQNLIDEVSRRTGGKPVIRLGGTSGDYAKYIPDQKEPALPVAEFNTHYCIGCTTIGPSYWALAPNFPNAMYQVQVPLATTNTSETVAWAKSAADIMGLHRIHSFQIGNEPNAYNENYTGTEGVILGPPEYQGALTNETYTGNFTKYAALIEQAVDIPRPFFTAFETAAKVVEPQDTQWMLKLQTNFGLGIDAGNIVKEVGTHFYEGPAETATDLASDLMNVTHTHTLLNYRRSQIDWLKDHHPEIPYVLDEIGNSLDTSKFDGGPYQARLGSALWNIEFSLYSLWIGVARLNWQQIMSAAYDLWLPVESDGQQAQVYSNFYALMFVSDFIGCSGTTKVTKFEIAAAPPNLAAYGAVQHGVVKRLAIANLDYWNLTSSHLPRPSVTIDIKLPWFDFGHVKVTRITSPDGAGGAADNITYAGSQWTYASMGKEVGGIRNDTEMLAVRNGGVQVMVSSSEAVIVDLDMGLGEKS